jgi:hypothetical protein
VTPTEGAHWAVSRGFAVLPVWWPIEGRCACGRTGCGHAAKHPVEWLVPRGAYSASIEAAAKWWHSSAAPYNVGVALGPASGIVAVDVDPRSGGDRTLAALERRLGPLPETLRVETGRGDGGYHLYFRDPGVVVRGGVGAGVEVKGRGSYVVGPGSTHISGGKYRVVVDVAAVGLPDGWLAGLVRTSIGDSPLPPTCNLQHVRLPPNPGSILKEVAMWGYKARKTAARWSREETFALYALNNSMNELMRTVVGQRNYVLNAKAYALGRLVVRGWVGGDAVVLALGYGAECCGHVLDHGEAATIAVIRAGLLAGMGRPYPDLDGSDER